MRTGLLGGRITIRIRITDYWIIEPTAANQRQHLWMIKTDLSVMFYNTAVSYATVPYLTAKILDPAALLDKKCSKTTRYQYRQKLIKVRYPDQPAPALSFSARPLINPHLHLPLAPGIRPSFIRTSRLPLFSLFIHPHQLTHKLTLTFQSLFISIISTFTRFRITIIKNASKSC